ncbi:putative disease resistance RPP13-like protein 1 [Citrus sinensis]|uniref:Disease resistance RPP13-like protein 1 n=1 Tax=Citrus sinensis TaxID=2711 RepID=A0ACB8K653_CITSI|nr:putative disease resistance RPP13-like protein 1 [Citrus sinensis]
MSIIGEAILMASVEMLINKLASEGLRLFARQGRIQANLVKWKKMLEMIKAVLDDAEEKKTTNRSVKKWLGELQNLAYDVEDLLDEFETEAFRRKLLLGNGEPAAAHDQPSSSRTRSSKFRKLIPTCCTTFTPQSIQFDYAMMSKIKGINDRFQDIEEGIRSLNLIKSSAGGSKKARQRQETTSLVEEAKVYGRKTEKKEIVELLLKDDSRKDGGFSVIPIIGMGGLGKTTLAQLVYNDKQVEDHFNLKAWTCVSDDFDVSRLTKSILLSIAPGQNVDNHDLNKLQVDLKKQLFGKKFLLVLDDVWNENYTDWVHLSLPFQAGAQGSKIVVTTRNEEVAKIMSLDQAYELKSLSTEDCLSVFAQHSLGTTDFSSHKSLEDIGKNIVIKCNGLPLAAKTLGGLLRGKRDRSDWEDVLSCKIWDLPEERCDIIPALRVSYYYLSAPLKQCFAYCSLFPKDYEFEEEEIILLWCAQSSNSISRFVMHDLISDLAQWAAGEIYFTMEYTLEVNKQQGFSKNLRHLSYIPGYGDGVKRFEDLYDIQHLRTFLPVKLSNRSRGYLAHSILPKLFKLQRLRVFSLFGYRIYELPNSVVNKLYNLHSLSLEDCRKLKKLCAEMGNLIKLHHLKNSNTDSLEEMPLGIGNLTCLQTLCNFVVAKDSGSGLRELKSLTHLKRTLKISKLENVKCVGDAMEAQMDGKKNLKELSLNWTCSTDGSSSREAETEMGVLDMLKPHTNLEQFCIKGYGGTVAIRLTGYKIRKTGYGAASFHCESGLPDSKSGKPETGQNAPRSNPAYRIPNPADRIGKILNFALTVTKIRLTGFHKRQTGFPRNEFHRVSNCSNAYEIWRKLEIVYEETTSEEEFHEVSNLALMAIGDESDDELDESNSSSTEKVVFDDNVDEELQEDYQMIAKRRHHLKIKRSSIKKQMRSKMKVLLKYSPRSGGTVAIRLTGYKIRKTGYGAASFHCESGLPDSKSGKPETGQNAPRSNPAYRIPNPADRIGKILNFALTVTKIRLTGFHKRQTGFPRNVSNG